MKPIPASTKAGLYLGRIREEVPALPLLWAGGRASWPAGELGLATDEELVGVRPSDPDMVAALRGGLLLRADLFEEPHAIFQGIPAPTGSYWHGIAHRREPDFSNARYWFRRAGDHPFFETLFAEIESLFRRPGGEWRGEALERIVRLGRWDPVAFANLCEECVEGERPGLLRELESIQELEIELLLSYCYAHAV